MKAAALLLAAGVVLVGASVLVPGDKTPEIIQQPPSVSEPYRETPDRPEPSRTPTDTQSRTENASADANDDRRRGSSIVDAEPQGSGFAEGQHANGEPDPDDDCHHNDEDFPWCDEDPPSER